MIIKKKQYWKFSILMLIFESKEIYRFEHDTKIIHTFINFVLLKNSDSYTYPQLQLNLQFSKTKMFFFFFETFKSKFVHLCLPNYTLLDNLTKNCSSLLFKF